MKFNKKLLQGTLIKRYKRFFTDIKLNKEIVIMHPGPINRGVEITSDIADGDQSIILNQVENGVAVRMALLYLAAGGEKIKVIKEVTLQWIDFTP